MVNLETIMSELNELEAKEIFTIPYNSTRINHRENAECLQAFAKEQLEVSDKFDSPAFAFENIDIHAGFEPPKSVKVGNYTLREYSAGVYLIDDQPHEHRTWAEFQSDKNEKNKTEIDIASESETKLKTDLNAKSGLKSKSDYVPESHPETTINKPPKSPTCYVQKVKSQIIPEIMSSPVVAHHDNLLNPEMKTAFACSKKSGISNHSKKSVVNIKPSIDQNLTRFQYVQHQKLLKKSLTVPDYLSSQLLEQVLNILGWQAGSGLTKPFIYSNSQISLFPLHVEDLGLPAMNLAIEGDGYKLWIFYNVEDTKTIWSRFSEIYVDKLCPFPQFHKYMFISPKKLHETLGVKPWFYKQRKNSLVVSRSFTSHEGFTVGELTNIATNSASIEYLTHRERPPYKTWILDHANHLKRKQEAFLKDIEKNIESGNTEFISGDNGLSMKAEFVNYQNCGSTGMNNQEWLLDVANTADVWERALRAYLLKDAISINKKRAEPVKRYCICGQGEYGSMVACDNEACATGWFHFKCVGLQENQPVDTGAKWFCSDCERYACSKQRKVL